MVRGPWLKRAYGPKIYEIFKQAKTICDPKDLLNPHKKVDADWDYSFAHIRQHF